MNRTKITLQLCLCFGLLFALIFFSAGKAEVNEGKINSEGSGSSLLLWYTDEKLSDYLADMAEKLRETEGIELKCEKKEGLDFLETIEMAGSEGPDLYIAGGENLEEIYEKGLYRQPGVSENDFSPRAVEAASYQGEILAYPFSFDCSFLLSNRDYLEDYARNMIEAELVQEMADAGETQSLSENTVTADEEQVFQRAEEYIPGDFESLKAFAEVYDAPAEVTGVLGWDSGDIFYNYFILGDSIDLSDELEELDIYNSASVSCLEAYQELYQFFSLSEEVSYEQVKKGIVSGNYVFAVASADILKELPEDRNFTIEALPVVSEGVQPLPLGQEKLLFLNSLRNNGEETLEAAEYMLSREGAGLLYSGAGLLMPRRDFCQEDERREAVLQEYERSVLIPRRRSRADYWMKLKIAFMDAADGKNPDNILQALENSIK